MKDNDLHLGGIHREDEENAQRLDTVPQEGSGTRQPRRYEHTLKDAPRRIRCRKEVRN